MDSYFSTVITQATDFLQIFEELLKQQNWVAILTVVFFTVFFERLSNIILDLILKLTKRTKTELDDQLVSCSSRPIGNYIILFGAYVAGQIFQFPTAIKVKAFYIVLIKVLLVLNTILLLWRIVDIIGTYLFQRVSKTGSTIDDHLVPIFQMTAKIFVTIIGILYTIQAMGYSVSGLLAGLGIGGLAVAMAAKDTLANFFGSIMILMDRPFKIGDWIKTGNDEGVVEQIGFRSTRIRTFPKTLISVPNSVIANTPIDNFSRMPKRRVKIVLGISYETSRTQMRALVTGIKKIIADHPGINQEFSLVNFTDFSPSSLDILIYYFTATTDWAEHLSIRQEVNFAIMQLVEEMGVSIALPAQDIYIRKKDHETMPPALTQ